jgi:hypothetical protein
MVDCELLFVAILAQTGRQCHGIRIAEKKVNPRYLCRNPVAGLSDRVQIREIAVDEMHLNLRVYEFCRFDENIGSFSVTASEEDLAGPE